MTRFSNIISVESKADIEEGLVERFVQQNVQPKISRQYTLFGMGDFADSNEEIECCAAELPVNGTVEIFFIAKDVETLSRINYPVNARFVVFCTRAGNNNFKVAWISSLT